MKIAVAAFLFAKGNVEVNHKKSSEKKFRAQIYSN
ncbi:hypothetical protein SAMN05216273_12031 [Chryseobacterium taihuense]|uniref:Uncharacterized protein n=1 Tax=Chryseobacterium taihuense TaxID=1141221 RepID=A0ABY0R222_9FLAO|nr:hypothetical protein SAMN05216273_12031 [Chryseobacterium taihuense]